MTPNELTARVQTAGVVLAVAVAAGAIALGGVPAALGVLTGGMLALANFRWLASTALAASGVVAQDPPRAWLPWTALRFAMLTVAAAAVLLTGWAHPAAVLVGLTVVPCALVVAGLRGARDGQRGERWA